MKERSRKWLRGAIGCVRRRLGQWVDPPTRFAAALVVAAAAAWWVVGEHSEWAWDDTWHGVFIEAAGAVMDLVVFGIVIGVVVGRRNQKREIRSHQALIDDFRKWDSEEGRRRIAGAVRRLNRLGRTSIDFVGMEMSAFSFRDHDIESIAGSKFYTGAMSYPRSQVKTVLRGFDFSSVDCSNVVFSASWPWKAVPDLGVPRNAQLQDCWFTLAILKGATFKGASMVWTKKPSEKTKAHLWPFCSADLAGASFEGVEFVNADFRGALNIRQCRFAGATGLEECMFECEEDKKLVLGMASRPDSIART